MDKLLINQYVVKIISKIPILSSIIFIQYNYK